MSDKGISLRTKTKRKARPAISAPKQISGPIQQQQQRPGAALVPTRSNGSSGTKSSFDAPSQNRPQQRPPQAGGKTSDLVKRRYSTRFNNLPGDYDASQPPVPSIPSTPGQYASSNDRGRGPSPARGPGLAVDKKALQDRSLRPEQYVAGLLSNASEQDIDEYMDKLRKSKHRTSTDLQQNVLQNRTQFIKISKEAEKLKGEMRSLRNLMSDVKTNTTVLRSASAQRAAVSDFDGGFPSTLSKRDKRSSVADRSAMWNSQLQALYKNVEGSQKFLPALPGRHVIQNAGLWIELDSATWKSRRAMQIFLLNDHLLIASRKKRKADANGAADQRGPPSKLVADRCWPVLDIEMVDLAGTSDAASGRNKVADAIMIRGVGQESFTYRTEKPDDNDKHALMMNFRKAVEELRRSLRSEMESTNKAKETINYFASRDPGLLKKTELLETLSDIKDMLIEVDGKQQNLRWVESQVDELDIDIALQRFDDAVQRVEKLNALAKGLKNNIVAQDFITFKADERASRLAGLITRELVDTHNELKKTKLNIKWLSRLGFEDRAREAYLEARGNIIHKRSRQCIFEGNLHQYIWEVSFVYFTIIRNTVSTFQMCFPPLLMSACVKWAKEQVDAFNTILARQLSSTEREGPVWTECMNQAMEHAKMLSDVGLDFKSFIGRDATSVEQSSNGPVGLGLA